MERDGRRERFTGKGEQMHALDRRRVTDWRKKEKSTEGDIHGQ